MAERVDQAIVATIDDAIDEAIVDLEAPAGERVRFDPAQLAAVAALYRDDATRPRVVAALRARLSAAILAIEAAVVQDEDWHDAQATQALLSLVQEEDPAGGAVQP